MPSKMRGFYRKGGFYGRYNRVTRHGMTGESKFHETTLTLQAINDVGEILLNTILIVAEGFNESTRIGRKIYVTRAMFRGKISMTASTGFKITQTRVRIIVYLDTQTNGTAAGVLEIFKDGSINSFRNLGFSHRFQILHDRIYTLRNNITSGTAAEATFTTATADMTCNIYLKGAWPIYYNSDLTTGVLSTIESNRYRYR